MVEVVIGDIVMRAGADVDEAHLQRVIPSGAVGMIPSGVKVFLASHPIDFRNYVKLAVMWVRRAIACRLR
ncbi:hypothetical protein QN224_33030 [Sinorhizobium sp. 8-89]|uniref:hypothetical protein n=1 Tax=Sinorhizobium sp. 7-81 TaxID=3049087 RepID=UPI0024C2413D|nr:hypothetical protein [Sinorhizobium sp. 7-81]